MPYTLNVMLLDLGGWYSASLPPVSGRFFVPPPPSGSAAAPVDTAANNRTGPTPLTLLFASAAVPPSAPFTLHLVDTGSGGDLFRSGVLSSVPPSPGSCSVITAPTIGLSTATLTATIAAFAPTTIAVPAGVSVVSGILTLGTLIPLSAAITSILPVPGAPLTFTVTGSVTSQRFWFARVISTFTFTFTLGIAPSGDSASRSRILAVSVPASTLGGNTLSPTLNFTLGPVLGAALAGFAEPALNGILASTADSTLEGQGFRLSPTGTLSARRITTTASGVSAQLAISDVNGPGVLPLPKHLAVLIAPTPSTAATVGYTINVRNAVTGIAVSGASVTVKNFTQTGAVQSLTGTTNTAGVATITATLRGRVIFGIRYVDGERERVRFFTPPTLLALAAGFNDFSIPLLEDSDLT